MRRLLAVLVLAGGPLLYLTRRRENHRDAVHLYHDDGSVVTLELGAPGSERLVARARAAL